GPMIEAEREDQTETPQPPSSGISRRILRGAATGTAAGWVIGILGYTLLFLSFGSFDMLLTAPVWAVPFGVVGGTIGAVLGAVGGRAEVAFVLAGTLIAVAVHLVSSPFDGWLALTLIPAGCLGAFLGMAVGFIVANLVRAVWPG